MANNEIGIFYSQNPYPNYDLYFLDNGKINPFMRTTCVVDDAVPNHDILVIGCGTVEANVISQSYPKDFSILGIDMSEPSIEISKKISVDNGFDNVEYIVGDFIEQSFDKKFGAIYAHGVLHHNIDNVGFVNKVANLLDEDRGYFFGMVYDAGQRQHILETREHTTKLNNPAEVAEYLKSLPEDHPSRQWYEFFDKSDVEVSDTWLNPYAKHYEVSELLDLLSGAGLSGKIYNQEKGKICFYATKKAA